jgi:hypothetical protein
MSASRLTSWLKHPESPFRDGRVTSLVESAEALPHTRAVDWDAADGMRFGEGRQLEPALRVVQLDASGRR